MTPVTHLSGTGPAAFGIGHDAVSAIDEIGRDERAQGEDDRGSVTAGVGDKMRTGDLGAMQLGESVDGLGLNLRGNRRAVVLEGIDGAVGRFVQAPRAAEVNDAQAMRERLGHPLTRLLMRCSKEQNLDAAIGKQLPRKGLEL